jgi:hypothetical protein
MTPMQILSVALEYAGSVAGPFDQRPTPPWHFLNFLPLPHGHGELRPTLPASRTFNLPGRSFSHFAQVQAAGWSVNQLGLFMSLHILR